MAPPPKYSSQEQENMILDAAAQCIEQTSLIDFTMSSVAKTAGMSMGSIYKHVQCKEDIIFALAIRVYHHQSSVFEQVIALPLTTPERLIGISLLNPLKIQVYSFDIHLDAFVTNELVVKRTSKLWRDRMIDAHKNCEQLFYRCMSEAVDSGELSAEGEIEEFIEEINLGGWALTVGYQSVMRVVQIREIAQGDAQLHEPTACDAPIVRIFTRLFNSYQWQKPLDSAGIKHTAQLLTKHNLR
ncbi:MAG: TetR/AcrR family transcriptional regulator [Moritella sp.]|nr:TetR/AcrR family transcriptional regulator [Moritella sp.]